MHQRAGNTPRFLVQSCAGGCRERPEPHLHSPVGLWLVLECSVGSGGPLQGSLTHSTEQAGMCQSECARLSLPRRRQHLSVPILELQSSRQAHLLQNNWER